MSVNKQTTSSLNTLQPEVLVSFINVYIFKKKLLRKLSNQKAVTLKFNFPNKKDYELRNVFRSGMLVVGNKAKGHPWRAEN